MRKFRKSESEKRKRKQAKPAVRAAARPGAVRILGTLLLVVVLTLSVFYVLRGSTSARENSIWRFKFEIPVITPEQVAAIERNRRASLIDVFFSGRRSPLTGMGHIFLDAEAETGVSAELLAAITLAESSCATDGSLSDANHNAWGMKGPQPALGIPAQNGYCWWPDWPAAIHGAAHFIRHYWGPAQTANELKGYAASGGSWASNVEGVRLGITG